MTRFASKNPNLTLFLGLIVLATITITSYLELLKGREFLFDDKAFLHQNPAYQKLSTLKEALSFTAKPGRPVSNLLIGIGHWLDPASPRAQRLISILNHAGVVLLLFLYLSLLGRRFALLPTTACFVIALLFAVHPVSTEAIGITYFRGRLTGSFFTLLALLAAHGLFEKASSLKFKMFFGTMIFIFLGAATFSNEEFGILAFLALALTSHFYLDSKPLWNLERLKYFCFLTLCQIVWASVLLALLKRDAASISPYQVGVGSLEIQPFGFQLLMSGKGILESLPKMFSGHQLSIMAAWTRDTPDKTLDELGTFLLFIEWGLLGYLIFYAKRWIQIWGAWFFLSLNFYLFFPNINIGAERYLYFPFIGSVSVLVYVVWAGLDKYIPRKSKVVACIMAIGLFVFWESQLQLRLRSYQSSLLLWGWEAQKRPELPLGWDNLRATLISQPCKLNELMEIKPLFENPSNHAAVFHLTEWVFFQRLKDSARAEAALESMREHFSEKDIRGLGAGIYQSGLEKKFNLTTAQISEIQNLAFKLNPDLEKTAKN